MKRAAATHVEAVVIGAGVIGIAVARALAQQGREVLLLERAAAIGSETSSRNSQVVHAGLYSPAHTLKTRLCVQGRQMLYQFCQQRAVDVQQCGKLVVAINERQYHETLLPLYHRAIQNNVSQIQLVSAEQAHDMEPALSTTVRGALWSPATGIVDAHAFMYSLLADAEQHGATLVLSSPVQDARIIDQQGVELYVGGVWVSCDVVINATGLWADSLAVAMHRGHAWQPPKQYYCKGNYFRFQGPSPFSRLVYPLPADEQGGLGIHATIDLTGNVTFGPDVEWLHETTTPDEINYTVPADRDELFYRAIQNYWPNVVQDGSLVPDYAGVRPKLSHPSSSTITNQHDFLIVGPSEHSVPGLIHLFGMESPGLTSAMAIAQYIVSEKLSGT